MIQSITTKIRRISLIAGDDAAKYIVKISPEIDGLGADGAIVKRDSFTIAPSYLLAICCEQVAGFAALYAGLREVGRFTTAHLSALLADAEITISRQLVKAGKTVDGYTYTHDGYKTEIKAISVAKTGRAILDRFVDRMFTL